MRGGVEGGGSLSLAALLAEHWQAAEADLQRYYGLDLVDVFRGTLTLRKVSVLVAGLPSDSLTMSAMAPALANLPEPDGTPRQWSTEAHLLASVVDAVTQLTVAYVGAHSKSTPKWEPMPRPTPKRAPQIHRMTEAQREALRQRGGPRGN